jgi:hypothetical protein
MAISSVLVSVVLARRIWTSLTVETVRAEVGAGARYRTILSSTSTLVETKPFSFQTFLAGIEPCINLVRNELSDRVLEHDNRR